jgi:hypothetical protein
MVIGEGDPDQPPRLKARQAAMDGLLATYVCWLDCSALHAQFVPLHHKHAGIAFPA